MLEKLLHPRALDRCPSPRRDIREHIAIVHASQHERIKLLAAHPVGVQVGSADAGIGDADDRVGALVESWLRDLDDADCRASSGMFVTFRLSDVFQRPASAGLLPLNGVLIVRGRP